MYGALLLILIGLAGYLIVTGAKAGSRGRVIAGILVGVLTVAFFGLMSFWAEMLWFDAVGYEQRFWTQVWVQVALAAGLGIGAWVFVWGLTWSIPREEQHVRIGAQALGLLVGINWGLAKWDILLKYWYGQPTGTTDPILSRDAAFYLFTLPFYDAIYGLLLLLALVGLFAGLATLLWPQDQQKPRPRWSTVPDQADGGVIGVVMPSAIVLILVLAVGKLLDRYHLLYSSTGIVTGPGWTDHHVRLPAYVVVALVTTLVAAALLYPPVRRVVQRRLAQADLSSEGANLMLVGLAGGLIAGIWIIVLGAIPGLFQWLVVEPNEITYEKPYIAHNIEYTRKGFKLDSIEEREYPVTGVFRKQTVEDNQEFFNNVRLWDYRALDAVYQQFQEIRLYYEFVDVDIDRYHVGEKYRQVMVSAREMEQSNLPKESQTFVNTRFKYTHGYGLTLTEVSEFTPQGLPNLLVKDIPPQTKHPSLDVKRPQIYYGELTGSYVVANSKEPEFDYPKGEENAYIQYPGKGGVRLANWWRKFLFGWKFDGTRFFLSGYPKPESRIMFHRSVTDRVQTLAPFLLFDRDPYIVLVDGRLHWIVDGYTSSDYYPYSEAFQSQEVIEYQEGRKTRALSTDTGRHLDGVNYLRNSVKAVVDAFDGTVDFYVFEPDDPLIKVWDKIFPGLLKSMEDMPHDLRAHVRYPADMLLVQGLMYAKYHMTDPAVFYNQEDLWIRATEKYYGTVQPVQPYYIMWEPPGENQLEFIIMLPFTPKNRQVLIGWIAGMCDEENYGRVLAYKFPKEKRILGPQQVETKIDQDSYLSGQLTLWDQRGSNVIRGNVLAIPVEETILYVEPIYLQAETAAYPELRLVAVMHNDVLSYAESFDKALEGLFGKEPVKEVPKKAGEPAADITFETLVEQANQAFENYLQYQSKRQFDDVAGALKNLEKALGELSRQVKPAGKNSREGP